jgi:hypothetical protein
MSALGQKQTSEYVRSMSALPPKADIGTQSRKSALCQKQIFLRAPRRLGRPLEHASCLTRLVVTGMTQEFGVFDLLDNLRQIVSFGAL